MKHPIVAVALLAVSLASQAAEQVGLRDLVASNNQALQDLEQGMSRAEVVRLMKEYVARTPSGVIGNPCRSETFQQDGVTYEVLYYLTRRPQYAFDLFGRQTQAAEAPTTPVVLRNGVVSGWGPPALQALRHPSGGG